MPAVALVPNEVLLDVFLFLKRHEIEKCQLVVLHWNSLILSNLSVIPLHLLQSIKIRPKFRICDVDYNGVEIFSDRLNKFISIPENKLSGEQTEGICIVKSLKYCVFEQFLDNSTSLESFETVERTRSLAELCNEKLKVIEYLSYGYVSDTIFILENYVSAFRAFIDTPIEQTLSILADKKLWKPPTNIELSFSISIFSLEFLEFLNLLDVQGQFQYQLTVRLNRNMDIPIFLESVVELYERSLDLTRKIRKIKFCNLNQGDIGMNFIKNRKNLISHTQQIDRVSTVDLFLLEISKESRLKLEMIQQELDRGYIEYSCLFELSIN